MPDIASSSRDLFVDLLINSVREIFKLKGGFDVSRKPSIVQKDVVSFHGRLRVDGMEKFNARTVFAVVKFYATLEKMERDQPLGAMIVFVEAEFLSKLLWMLEYPRIDEDDDAELLDGCGTLVNVLAGYFVKSIHDKGFVHLQMSHFESYINTALNGIAFASDQTIKNEISFHVQGLKRLVIELTMSQVPAQ